MIVSVWFGYISLNINVFTFASYNYALASDSGDCGNMPGKAGAIIGDAYKYLSRIVE